MPFSVVEMAAFKELVKGIQPNRSVICRPTVMKRIWEKATMVKNNVKAAMVEVQYVATTIDYWTAHHQSFIGVMGHRIDDKTLDQEPCSCLLSYKGQTHL